MFYLIREAKNSNAEIDYLIEKKSEIIPIEVKSGAKGMLKSLLMFIEKYKTKRALKISQAKYNFSEPIISLPFYGIESYLKNIHY